MLLLHNSNVKEIVLLRLLFWNQWVSIETVGKLKMENARGR